jgi:hypothetical protein
MEKGDISTHDHPSLACVFEGLLANPPKRSSRIFGKLKRVDDDLPSDLRGWTPNELPIKSLIDLTNRIGISTLVITFMGPDMEEPIYRWLLRKGVAPNVQGYRSIEEFREDLKYNRLLSTVYVADSEQAAQLGIRATVVSTTSTWSY